jgi:hypothetical protein
MNFLNKLQLRWIQSSDVTLSSAAYNAPLNEVLMTAYA